MAAKKKKFPTKIGKQPGVVTSGSRSKGATRKRAQKKPKTVEQRPKPPRRRIISSSTNSS